MTSPRSRLTLGVSLALLAGATSSARALEHVTLRTGFTYDCAHHEYTSDGHVRLFLDAATTDNYIDLKADQVVSVEVLPDPPSVLAAAVAPQAIPVADVPELLAKAGAQHNIDVELLASLVKAESGGHARAISRTGAQGLMQLMPGTASQLGVADAFRPEQNINGGTAYLDALLTRYHDNLAFALAAYNAGPGAVDKYHGVPPYRETRAYVVRVMTEFKKRKLADLAALKLPAR
jgi:soluble lytic murein transglycosylase-like protein